MSLDQLAKMLFENGFELRRARELMKRSGENSFALIDESSRKKIVNLAPLILFLPARLRMGNARLGRLRRFVIDHDVRKTICALATLERISKFKERAGRCFVTPFAF